VLLKTTVTVGIKSLLQSLGSCAVILYLNFEPSKLQIFMVREFCPIGNGNYISGSGVNGNEKNIFGNEKGNGNGNDCMGMGWNGNKNPYPHTSSLKFS